MKRLILLFVWAAISVSGSDAAALKEAEPEKIYDQRQNGTENYRINVDGVFVVIAPAEDLLEAAQGLDLDQLISLSNITDDGFFGQPSPLKGPKKPALALLNATGNKSPAADNPEKKQDNQHSTR